MNVSTMDWGKFTNSETGKVVKIVVDRFPTINSTTLFGAGLIVAGVCVLRNQAYVNGLCNLSRATTAALREMEVIN